MTWFVIDPEGYRYPVGRQGLSLGRAVDNDVILNDTEVSRYHATIEMQGDQAWLYDQDSSNGVFVKDRRIGGPYRLQDGDTIRLGSTNLRVARVRIAESIPVVPPSPQLHPSTFYQMLPAILVGAAVGMVGLALVVLFVVRPLVNSVAGLADLTPPSHSTYAEVLYGTAFLTTAIGETDSVNAATGVVVSENGRILTAYDAVYDPATQRPFNRNSQVKVGISTAGGGQPPDTWYTARVVRADREREIAILQIYALVDGAPLPNSFYLRPVPLGPGLAMQINEPIAVISYLGGNTQVGSIVQAQTLGIGEGQVLGFTPDINLQAERGWIQSDIGLSPRNIGGAALNQQGNVVGLYTGTGVGNGASLLRPIEYAQPLLAGF